MSIERTFYPNGQLESEVQVIDGNITGVSRQWYVNGQLHQEVEMRNSRPNGIKTQWSKLGELVDATLLLDGTGWARFFYDDGSLESEIASFKNAPHGPMFIFYEDGELSQEKFFLIGKAKTDQKSRGEIRSSLERLTQVSEDEFQILLPANQVATQPFRLENPQDAVSWLARQSAESVRTIGELSNRCESIEMIYESLQSGILRVLVDEIQFEEDNSQTVDSIYLVLSENKASRRSSFDYINSREVDSGYEKTLDIGQRVVHVACS